jgi:LacI family transcriptional regulator
MPCSWPLVKQQEGLRSLLQSNLPCVLMDRVLHGVPTRFVGTDDLAAGSMATEHLLSLKRRRIAHIGNSEVSTGADRFRG